MALRNTSIQKQSVGVSLTSTPKGLTVIRDPGCSAAIWHREPIEEFQRWINGLHPSELPSARIMLHAEMVRDAMSDLFDVRRLPKCYERTLLIDDIAALSAIFSSIMASRYLRVRLEVIRTNACFRFHIDAVTARLICTYRGRSTQYGNSIMGSEPEEIHNVPVGSPIIMRGTLWRSGVKPDLLHRSPQIEGTGVSRLVLILDPIDDIEANEFNGHLH